MALFGRSRALFTVVSAAVLAAQTLTVPAWADPGAGAAADQVVVLFKDQIPDHPATRDGIPARRAAVAADQQPTRDYLTAHHARDVHSFTSVNAISATVTPVQAAQLAADPSVARVIKNVQLSQSPPASTPVKNSSGTTDPSGLPAESGSSADACPGPDDPPQLEPESLQLLGVDSQDPHAKTARSLGYDGTGVTVGIIADRPDLDNADFIRPDGSHVITDYEDFTGYYANNGPDAIHNGGEGFLDASSVAAQGRTVYDVSTFGALQRTTPCRIRVEGVSPGASLVILDPFGPSDGAYLIPTLQAIDYALTVAHVDILNESFGALNWPDDSGAQDAMDAANDAAVAAGVTVTVCQRGRGPVQHDHRHRQQPQRHRRRRNHILPRRAPDLGVGGEPGRHRMAIRQHHLALVLRVHRAGDHAHPGRAGRPRLDGLHPRCESVLLLPGHDGRTERGDRQRRHEHVRTPGRRRGRAGHPGVREAHHGAKPGPALIKQILTSTADDIDAPAEQQGSGLVDAYRAVLAARAIAPAPATSSQNSGATSSLGQPAPAVPLLEGTGQFNSVAAAGTVNRFTQQVTNLGSRPVTVQRVEPNAGHLHPGEDGHRDPRRRHQPEDRRLVRTAPGQLREDHLHGPGRCRPPGDLGHLAGQPISRPGHSHSSAGFATPDITLIDPRGRLANASAWKNGSANHHGVAGQRPAARHLDRLRGRLERRDRWMGRCGAVRSLGGALRAVRRGHPEHPHPAPRRDPPGDALGRDPDDAGRRRRLARPVHPRPTGPDRPGHAAHPGAARPDVVLRDADRRRGCPG